MIRIISSTILLAGTIVVMSWPANAHHSDRMYDQENPITLDGVVSEFQYTNPHSWLLVDVDNEDGTVTTWGFEGASVSNMQRAGIRPSDLAPGTRVTVNGYPMRDGRPAAEWIVATREEDGQEFHPNAGFQVR